MDKKEIIVKKVLITGSDGFIGKNLREGLRRLEDVEIKTFDIEDNLDRLSAHLKEADIVFHLAGVNRPEKVEEFEIGNANLTKTMVNILEGSKKILLLCSHLQFRQSWIILMVSARNTRKIS